MARIGIIGNGGFTDFLLRSWRDLPEVEVTAIAARNAERLRETARRHGIPHAFAGERSWQELLAEAPVDLVAIVTPPSLHVEMAVAAAEAGKGILCEKPLGITVKSGERLRAAVQKRKVPFVINYVMRYNPLFRALKSIVEGDVLGGLRRVEFTNLASDEGLPPDHWFWDLTQSGGILVEHGVHFFDVYGWLIGAEAEAVQGYRTVRAGTKQEDRVVATVHYANGALGTYYHAFDRPSRLESQQALLSFDQGTIRVNGWIAISAHVDAAVSNAQADRLIALLPPAAIPHEAVFTGTAIHAQGGGATYRFDRRLRYESKFAPDQGTMYAQNVRDSIMDLVAAWQDPSHRVRAGIDEALASLRVACAVR